MTVEVRDAVPSDEPFLRAVYASTRADELAAVGWDDDAREAFLRQQFDAQAADYRRRFPQARFGVVEVDGVPVGRLYTAASDDEVHVLDIAVLPEHRGRGVGRVALSALLDSGRTVLLTVARWNPAQRLYSRLGFVVVGEDAVHLRMAHPPR